MTTYSNFFNFYFFLFPPIKSSLALQWALIAKKSLNPRIFLRGQKTVAWYNLVSHSSGNGRKKEGKEKRETKKKYNSTV